jgi:hypothetical protein
MKRNKPSRRSRRLAHRLTMLAPQGLGADGRVTLAVLWALGRLALRLGPA